MTIEYQIDNVFTNDPTLRGWGQFEGASFAWDSSEKVGGLLGIDADARYIKYLPKDLTEADHLIARFVFEVEDVVANTGGVLFGFFNTTESGITKHVFGLRVINSTGTPVPRLDLAYSDGTLVSGTGVYALTPATKYIAVVRYVPEDGQAYLTIYDFLTEQVLFEDIIALNTAKDFLMQQVGMSETGIASVQTAKGWLYEVKAVSDPETVVYTSLYCTPEEARGMTNLDAVTDMSDAELVQIERIFVIPTVNARFRSEGYAAPFEYGTDTPPVIRTISALLTAMYAAKKAYLGHSPSESPNYDALLNEVNSLYKKVLTGQLELLDKNNAWIERTLATSTDMLSTNDDDELALFTLDDVPDITDIMSGRLYVGRSSS